MAVRQWWMMGWPATSKRGYNSSGDTVSLVLFLLLLVAAGQAGEPASKRLGGCVSVWWRQRWRIVDEPWGRRGREVGNGCLEMRRQPADRDIVSIPIDLFVVFYSRKEKRWDWD